MNDLLKRVEAASSPDRELDLDLALALNVAPSGDAWERRNGRYNQGGHPELRENRAPEAGPWPTFRAPAYTASLDAALALVERVLPDAYWNLEIGTCSHTPRTYSADLSCGGGECPGATPALAVIAAMLHALHKRGGNV